MATSGLTQFTDSANRTAFKDSAGNVYTEGGNTKTGYNVNDWNKRQLDRYGNSSSSSSSSPSGSDMNSIIQKAIEMQQQAVKPSINQLQSTIGSTGKSFDTRAGQLQAEKQPLQDRYDSLISSIKGNQTTAENRQTVTTNNELGKRGIPLTSGVAQQEVTNAVNPITQQYTGLIKDTGFQENADLRDLENQITNLGLSKTDSLNAINSAIAQLQSGAGQQGINTGLGIYSANQAQSNLDRQFAADQAAKKAQDSQYTDFIKALQGNVTGVATTPATTPTGTTPSIDSFVYNGGQGFDTGTNTTANANMSPLDQILYSQGFKSKTSQNKQSSTLTNNPLLNVSSNNGLISKLFGLQGTSYQ